MKDLNDVLARAEASVDQKESLQVFIMNGIGVSFEIETTTR